MKTSKSNTCTVAVDMDREMADVLEAHAAVLHITVEKVAELILQYSIEHEIRDGAAAGRSV